MDVAESKPPGSNAMTLVELLVVIAILGILAALLLPAVHRAKIKRQVQTARLEVNQIASAIATYESFYGHFPVSSDAAAAAAQTDDDVTYGGTIEQTHTWIAGPPSYRTNNCEVMAVLLDLEFYGDGTPTINQGHLRNPRQEKFLQAGLRDGTNALPGVCVDGVFRDPWASPYIISLDLNGNGRTRDVFYREPAVSEDPDDPQHGLNGLVRVVDGPGRVYYEAPTPVMVWSTGPDHRLKPDQPANRGVNRDNILSWKQ